MNNLLQQAYVESQLARTEKEAEYWLGIIEREELKEQSRENKPEYV